jgi:hypothetical protein
LLFKPGQRGKLGPVMRCIPASLLIALLLLVGSSPLQAAAKSGRSGQPTAGLEIAKTLTMITGVAISPLLGVGAVGAWTYFDTPSAKKETLPWYAHPWFWIPALLMVALVFLKDTAGTALPETLKKPMDVVETVESKISGLVAAGAFIPLVATFLPELGDSQAHQLAVPGVMFAAIDFNALVNFLLKPFAMIAFVIVWLAAHAINILILLSPFAVVDLALKSFRTFLLSLVVGTHFINHTVGMIFAVAIMLVSTLIAGWSFRAACFGGLFCWDFFTRRHRRFQPDPRSNWMFSAHAMSQVPIRTYGRLSRRDDGSLVFEFRPWLVLPPRQVKLAPGTYALGRGLFLRRVLRLTDNDEYEEVLTLPPRYGGHEATVTRLYGFEPEREIGLLRAILSVWRCLKWLIGFGAPASVPTTG